MFSFYEIKHLFSCCWSLIGPALVYKNTKVSGYHFTIATGWIRKRYHNCLSADKRKGEGQRERRWGREWLHKKSESGFLLHGPGNFAIHEGVAARPCFPPIFSAVVSSPLLVPSLFCLALFLHWFATSLCHFAQAWFLPSQLLCCPDNSLFRLRFYLWTFVSS